VSSLDVRPRADGDRDGDATGDGNGPTIAPRDSTPAARLAAIEFGGDATPG
jgi:hypothetical protein